MSKVREALAKCIAGLNTNVGVPADAYNGIHDLVAIHCGDSAGHHLSNIVACTDDGMFYIDDPVDASKFIERWLYIKVR